MTHEWETSWNVPLANLTKRELFAAMAMQGVAAADDDRTLPPDRDLEEWRSECAMGDARYAVRVADALLAALNEPNPKETNR